MMSPKKIQVAVLYGGRSGEHEVSLRSGASVIKHLDRSRFDVVPVAIDKQGRWHLMDLARVIGAGASLPVDAGAPLCALAPYPHAGETGNRGGLLIPLAAAGKSVPIDVIFPVMHGPMCEDGTVQGLFELAEVPYVGCGVLASSVGMDKEVSKRLVRDAGIRIVPYVSIKHGEWKREVSHWQQRIARELSFPVFVKPANLGSSVGIHRVKDASALVAAINDAFRFDTKVLVEKAVTAREIELAVLESAIPGEPPRVSVPGEVIPHHEFYSYEAKYLDENGAGLEIPAQLADAQVKEAQSMAAAVFMALECEGLTRCDLFLDKNTGEFYFNEVNTIPGFTSISMYPKMWEASGIPYAQLLSHLIDLAMARHAQKAGLVRELGK